MPRRSNARRFVRLTSLTGSESSGTHEGSENTMKKLSAVVLLFLAASWLGAAEKNGGRIRIGFSMDTLKEERWLRDRQFVEQRGAALGATVEVAVANGDDDL